LKVLGCLWLRGIILLIMSDRWLKGLYDNRHHWVPTFVKKIAFKKNVCKITVDMYMRSSKHQLLLGLSMCQSPEK
jgi:hypothetical protein